MRFRPDAEVQRRLEETVAHIARDVRSEIIAATEVLKEDRGDLKIGADQRAHDLICEAYPGLPVLTEEDTSVLHTYDGSEIIIADPIDGSSELVRKGPFSSPTSTSIMAMRGDEVLGAAIGHIWKDRIYGMDEDGLYRRIFHSGDKIPLPNGPRDEQHIVLAAYARKAKRAGFLRTIADLLEDGTIRYFENDGGGMYPIETMSGTSKGFTCSIELLPKGLWEHIPAIMALHARYPATNMGGRPLILDPTCAQTSIVSANQHIQQTMINAFRQAYAQPENDDYRHKQPLASRQVFKAS